MRNGCVCSIERRVQRLVQVRYVRSNCSTEKTLTRHKARQRAAGMAAHAIRQHCKTALPGA